MNIFLDYREGAMKNKKLIIALAGVAALILIVVLSSNRGTGTDTEMEGVESQMTVYSDKAEKADTAYDSGTDTSVDETVSDGSEKSDSLTSDNEDKGSSTNNQKKDSNNTNVNITDGAVREDDQAGSTSYSISSQNASWKNLDNGKESTSEERREPSPSPVIAEDLSFPYTIPDRDLVVRKIASYDGLFLEDGSDTDVEGIAVIILENVGTRAVEYTEINISGTEGVYTFECSDLPAGGIAVVQEKNAIPYKEHTSWRRCECVASMLDELEMSEDKVKVTENGDGSLLVENITEEDIPCIRVFYKFYSKDDDAYVGGITYTVKITDLAAGGQTTATPSHYVQDFSKIMMVRTYDTAEG